MNLYSYDEETGTFQLEQEEIVVESGYAVFTLDHCSTWAVSDEDLSALEPVADAAGEASEIDATTVDVHAQDGSPILIAGAVVAVVAVVAIVAVVLVRRKRAAAEAAAQQKAAEALFGDGASSEASPDSDAEPSEDSDTEPSEDSDDKE